MARMVTARQAAEELGVVERTVRRWIVAGELPAAKERGAFVIDLDAARDVHRRSRAGRTIERSTEFAELRGRYKEVCARLEQVERGARRRGGVAGRRAWRRFSTPTPTPEPRRSTRHRSDIAALCPAPRGYSLRDGVEKLPCVDRRSRASSCQRNAPGTRVAFSRGYSRAPAPSALTRGQDPSSPSLSGQRAPSKPERDVGTPDPATPLRKGALVATSVPFPESPKGDGHVDGDMIYANGIVIRDAELRGDRPSRHRRGRWVELVERALRVRLTTAIGNDMTSRLRESMRFVHSYASTSRSRSSVTGSPSGSRSNSAMPATTATSSGG